MKEVCLKVTYGNLIHLPYLGSQCLGHTSICLGYSCQEISKFVNMSTSFVIETLTKYYPSIKD